MRSPIGSLHFTSVSLLLLSSWFLSQTLLKLDDNQEVDRDYFLYSIVLHKFTLHKFTLFFFTCDAFRATECEPDILKSLQHLKVSAKEVNACKMLDLF